MASQAAGDGQAYTLVVIRQLLLVISRTILLLLYCFFSQRLFESEPRSGALDMGWKSRALTDSTDIKDTIDLHRDHSILPKQHAIKRFPLKGESIKGGSTVYDHHSLISRFSTH